MPRPSVNALAIICSLDTVFLYDCWALDQVKAVGQRFLQVAYAVRAGSNEGLGNTVLFCVDKGKLQQALKARTFRSYDVRNLTHVLGNPDEYELFEARLFLLGTNANNYQVKFIIHDESRSQSAPATNHTTAKQLITGFDPARQIFSSAQKKIAGPFYVTDPKTKQIIKLSTKEKVPFIALDNTPYCFIKGKWYEEASTGKQQK